MYDHICSFTDEAAARSALPQFCAHGPWDSSRVIAPLSIITAEAVWSGMELVTPEQQLPGFWLAIALPALSPDVRDLPDNACRYIADRVAAAQGLSWARYVAPDVDPALLASVRVAPVFAGSAYSFGT
jgi:hypothetical protein